MNAGQARNLTRAWHRKAQRENQEYNRKRIAREGQRTEAVWQKRGDALVAKINHIIEKFATEGRNGTYEPSDLNPNGDEVIWLSKADQPIFEAIMNHFRNEGYEVEEYQNHGMKITW